MKLNKYIILIVTVLLATSLFAQETKKDINKLSKNEVLEMTIEELSFYDLEELTKLMDIVGASSLDELYEMLLNKDVTSASKTEESLFDSPLSTTVLSSEEISASGATSIEEALRMVPGVIVREKTNGNYDVQIRGGQNMPMNNLLLYAENTSTLVMIDGRPVFNYGMGGILWESLPVSLGEIDRIEVVRGPSSALYGPNAVNGVINLITKTIDDSTPLITANAQGGSQGTYIADINFKTQLGDKVGVGISSYFEQRDRNTGDVYSFYSDEYLSIEEFGEKNNNYLWSNDDASLLFDDPNRAKEKLGVNGYIEYNPNSNLSFNLNGGYIDNSAISSPFGDTPTPYNCRDGWSHYLTLNGDIYGFNLIASLSNNTQDYNKGHTGWVQDFEIYNLSLDYLIDLQKLKIRPGVSYQSVYQDDRDHIEYTENGYVDGYFNRRVNLKNAAVSARFDYSPIENIRLVAALRGEKYNVPNKWMPSFQFIGSYKLNKNNMVRAVYSRANQSTFMINAHSNYTWNREGLGAPEYVYFGGNDDPNLMTMDMIELGFRTRPSKKVLLDFELFMNKAKDFSALMPDMFGYNVTGIDMETFAPIGAQTLYTSHRPLDIESKQYGISVSADMVISKKIQLKAHLNWQQTKVDNFTDASRDNIARLQGAYLQSIAEAGLANDIPLVLTGNMSLPLSYYSNIQPGDNPVLEQQLAALGVLDQIEVKDDIDNEAIPSFWGSLSLTYKPIEKLSVTAQTYYYDDYFLYSQYDTDSKRMYLTGADYNPYTSLSIEGPAQKSNLEYTGNMDGKFLLNVKVDYEINDKVNVFVNGRNILNNDQQEYVYMDNIGALYLAGFNIKF